MTALNAILHRSSSHESGTFTAVLTAALSTIGTWQRRAVQRRELATLSVEMLEDIGITPGEATRESNKPFWVE